MGRLENATMLACEQVAALYRVPCMRQQSRTFAVPGAKGRMRPLFVGEWTDHLGVKHHSGMADLFLMPHIRFIVAETAGASTGIYVTVPLWVETKSKDGVLSDEQYAFRRFVIQAGAYHLTCRESADALLEWFKLQGVKR